MTTQRTGSVKWIKRLQGDFGRLAITSLTKRGPVVAEYDVQVERFECGTVSRYVIVQDNDQIYDLAAELDDCNCPDASRRGVACKHQKGLKAALAAL